MTTECKVFHGVGAVIAQVTSHTKFSVLAIVNDEEDIDFSKTSRLFEVDLQATPKAPTSTFTGSGIKFDDRGVDQTDQELAAQLNGVAVPLGITTLGSGKLKDLTRGGFVGAVYIEHDHFNRIRKTAFEPDPWPGESFDLYQITSVAYSQSPSNGTRAGKRYHGFRGTVTAVNGRTVELTFQKHVQKLDDDGEIPLGPFRFNLDDAHQCDSDPPPEALDGAPSIAMGPITTGKEGAFFVALPHAASLNLSGGKLPIGFGRDEP